VGVMGQRLVRKICAYCKEPYEIESETLRGYGIEPGTEGMQTLHRGRGCVKCRGTGYLGRVAIFEILKYSDTLREMTTPTTDVSKIKQVSIKEGMMTLRQDAVQKMLNGVTTYEEVLRVTWGTN
jgi:general secretion pathway protein E